MRNISYLEQKCGVNIILLEPDSTASKGKKIVRKRPIMPQNITVNLLIERGLSQKLLEPIVNFTLLTIQSGIPVSYICDLNPRCKYKTEVKANFERHKLKCAKLAKKQITCKQKAYGDDSSILEKMVRKIINIFEILY